MTTVDLKPCPFCRKNAARIDSGLLDGRYGEEWWYQVECQQCGARGPISNHSAYDTTEAWRKVGALRASVKATKAEVTRLRAELAAARAEGEAAGRAAERAAVAAMLRQSPDPVWWEVARAIEDCEHVGAPGGAP